MAKTLTTQRTRIHSRQRRRHLRAEWADTRRTCYWLHWYVWVEHGGHGGHRCYWVMLAVDAPASTPTGVASVH